MGPADRFTRMEKIAVFLIALGGERAREIINDLDLTTVEQLNTAIQSIGSTTSMEKAAIMLEFARFFYCNEPVQGSDSTTTRFKDHQPLNPNKTTKTKSQPRSCDISREITSEIVRNSEHLLDKASKKKPESGIEKKVHQMLEKLRQHLDPETIDWGRAGYDFGDGFKGPTDKNR